MEGEERIEGQSLIAICRRKSGRRVQSVSAACQRAVQADIAVCHGQRGRMLDLHTDLKVFEIITRI